MSLHLILTRAAIAGVWSVVNFTEQASMIERYNGNMQSMVDRAVRKMIYWMIIEVLLIIGVAAT